MSTANNATTLLSNLILAAAVNQNGNPLSVIYAGIAGCGVVGEPPEPSGLGLPTPEQAFNLPAQLAVSLPALDALSKLPQIGLPQMPPPPPIGLPQFPIGMPQIGLPQPPPIGLPQIGLPQPPPIGLPPPPPPLFLALFGL